MEGGREEEVGKKTLIDYLYYWHGKKIYSCLIFKGTENPLFIRDTKSVSDLTHSKTRVYFSVDLF